MIVTHSESVPVPFPFSIPFLSEVSRRAEGGSVLAVAGDGTEYRISSLSVPTFLFHLSLYSKGQFVTRHPRPPNKQTVSSMTNHRAVNKSTLNLLSFQE